MGNSQNKETMSAEVGLTHFKLLRSIGRGSFGKVRMVEHKLIKKRYALKYFAKENLLKRKMAKNIVRERNILVSLNHPFVCNLRFAFQDDFNIYMGLDLMLGGDLRFHLARRKFSEAELIFIAAEIASALCYLHGSGVIHRDIKPDNILLDEKGHAHITDFNIATYIDPNNNLRSQSGTLQYMAPEVISGEGYDHRVDWWSLGVTLYECLYGKTPFHDAIKRYKRKEVIINENIYWGAPLHVSGDSEIFRLTQHLLVKDPVHRLAGSIKGSFAVQRLPSFNGIDWDLLNKKLLPPPFCPSAAKSNFDMSYDLEELLLEDSPLESLPSRRSTKSNKMTSEMVYLENSYVVYDYYCFQKSRRHSADFTKNAFASSSISIEGGPPSSQQVSNTEKQEDRPNSDPTSPQTNSPLPRTLRRLSRSLVDLQAANEKALRQNQMRNIELSPTLQEQSPQALPIHSSCVSSQSSISSEEFTVGQPSSNETAVSEKCAKSFGSFLRPKHKKFASPKKASPLQECLSTTALKYLPPDSSLSLPPTNRSLSSPSHHHRTLYSQDI